MPLFYSALLLVISLHLACGHSTSSPSQSHGKMTVSRETFVKAARAPSSQTHELTFAIKQNVEDLEDLVLELSDPKSPRYREWLTYDEVGALTSNKQGAEETIKWLEGNEITIKSICRQQNYIQASATINQWEQMLVTTFYKWNDLGNSKVYHRALEYSLPSFLAHHVSTVFGVVEVPFEAPSLVSVSPGPASFPARPNLRTNKGGVGKELKAATGVVDIAFLTTMYSIQGTGVSTEKQAVFASEKEEFSQQDLKIFQQRNYLPEQSAQVKTTGSNFDNCGNEAISCEEGNLDMQFIMGVSPSTESYFWYIDNADFNAFTTFLIQISNEPSPPKVLSFSWGIAEALITPALMIQFDTEAKKLALLGVTIVAATGDDGAPGKHTAAGCTCDFISSTNFSQSQGITTGWNITWNGKGYSPNFPASSPWVISIGGTMGPEKGTQEVACQAQEGGSVITTGGGFSTIYKQPAWQKVYVEAYFALAKKPADGYNIQGRAYPDVSVIASNYETVIGGQVKLIHGTSASAPVFAGLISNLNAKLRSEGKPTVGFINPAIYAAPATDFNDITVGDNKCCHGLSAAGLPTCCESGFETANGWDPVTGRGGIGFTELASLFAVDLTKYPTSQPTVKPEEKKGMLESFPLIYLVIVIAGLLAVVIVLAVIVLRNKDDMMDALDSTSSKLTGKPKKRKRVKLLNDGRKFDVDSALAMDDDVVEIVTPKPKSGTGSGTSKVTVSDGDNY